MISSRAGLRERLQQNLRLAAHQVNIKEEILGVRPHGGDDVGAEGDVRHKLAVHDVEVQPVGAGPFGAGGFFAQAGEIGGQQ